MKNHLTAAVERFKKSKGKEEYLINPISKLDAECIVELTEIFKKLNRGDLVSILNGWKYQKDEEVRDALLQWNIDNGITTQDSPDSGSGIPSIFDIRPRDFIKIGSMAIDLGDIFNYDKISEWDEDEEKYKHGFIINETPPEVTRMPRYANTKFFSINEDVRDVEYDRFETYFAGQDDINLI